MDIKKIWDSVKRNGLMVLIGVVALGVLSWTTDLWQQFYSILVLCVLETVAIVFCNVAVWAIDAIDHRKEIEGQGVITSPNEKQGYQIRNGLIYLGVHGLFGLGYSIVQFAK